MTCLISTIIPTIDRTTLSQAVRSVIDQKSSGVEFEIIDVSDSARKRYNASAYWHGRIAWIYLSSVVWNIQSGIVHNGLAYAQLVPLFAR